MRFRGFKIMRSKVGGVIQITIYSHMTYNASKKEREKRNGRYPPRCFHIVSCCCLFASCPHMMCELQCCCQVLGRLAQTTFSVHKHVPHK